MIDEAPFALPAWADPDAQLATLRADLDFAPGQRDDEIRGAFTAALGQLGGANGSLCRSLVPTVVRTPLRSGRSGQYLPLPPVISVIGFERREGGSWAEIVGATFTLDDGYLDWSGLGNWGEAVRAVYHAGYLDQDVPANLTQALRLMVRQAIEGHNDNRQKTIDFYLAPLQVYG